MKKVLIKETKNQFAWYSKKEGHIVEIERITLEGDAFVTKNGYLEITGKDMAAGLKSFISKGDFEDVYDIQVIDMPKGTPFELKNIILGGVFEAVKSDLHPDCFDFWVQDNICVTIPAQFCKVIDPAVEEAKGFVGSKARIRIFDTVYNKDYKDLAGMEFDVTGPIDTEKITGLQHPTTKKLVCIQPGDYMLVNAKEKPDALKSNLEGAKEIDKVSAFRTWMNKAADEARQEIKKYKAAFPGNLATDLLVNEILNDYIKEWHKRFNEAFETSERFGKNYRSRMLEPMFYRIGMDVANLKDHSAITIFKKVGEEFSVIDSWINGEKPFCASFLDRGIDLVRKEIDYAYGKAKEPAPKNPTEYVYRGGFRLFENYIPGDIVQYRGIYYQANKVPGKINTPDQNPIWKKLPDQNFTPDPAKKFIVEVNTNATSLKNYLKRRQKELKRAIGKYSSTGRPTPDYLKAELNEVEVQLIPKDGK